MARPTPAVRTGARGGGRKCQTGWSCWEVEPSGAARVDGTVARYKRDTLAAVNVGIGVFRQGSWLMSPHVSLPNVSAAAPQKVSF